MGLCLLDLHEPWKVLRRSEEWILGPQTPYELIGDVNHVVFPTGAVVREESQQLYLYYGAADNTIAVATAGLKSVSTTSWGAR